MARDTETITLEPWGENGFAFVHDSADTEGSGRTILVAFDDVRYAIAPHDAWDDAAPQRHSSQRHDLIPIYRAALAARIGVQAKIAAGWLRDLE